MQPAEIAIEKEPKQTRVRPGGPLQGVNRKIAALAAEAVQLAIKEEHRRVSNNTRIKVLCELVLAGNFSRMLKNSTLLTEADKDFLRGQGLI
jgi:hypothetical protein